MKNIIIRLATGEGDVTVITDRTEYIEHLKTDSRIIFALEYPTEEIAARELPRF